MNLLNKFWNTSARPDGRLGRLNLRFMNIAHTPMARWNLSLIAWQPAWTVLDVGCGGGRNLARLLRLCPKGKVYGIDISEDSVTYSRRKNSHAIKNGRCVVELGSADAMPFTDAMFDVVTAYETVYFWPDLPLAFAEVGRVLKPGATFTFSYGLKTDTAMRYWEEQVEAMHLLPVEEIKSLLTAAGFSHIHTTAKGKATINFRAIH
ncbi:MAG: class I SAM-dependent methyltransferase [Bacteroidaceae bacterium]|nr:class I SAM-dependent methyltransferase [Bacteroidaceae bacterium]